MSESDKPSHGKVLRQAREGAGLTQTQAAAAIGVKQGTISDWETDKTEPNWTDLESAERVYRVRLRADQAEIAFERGFAAGEFSALAEMTEAVSEMVGAIAKRARKAEARLSPPTPSVGVVREREAKSVRGARAKAPAAPGKKAAAG